LLLPPQLEPGPQLEGTSLSFHPRVHLHVVMGAGVLAQVEHSTEGTAFGIRCSEHHPAYPCLDQGPGAHWTRFEGDEQRAVVQAPVAAQPSCLLQGYQFCVAQGLLILLPPVAAPAHCPALTIEHHSGHWNLTLGPHRCGPPQ